MYFIYSGPVSQTKSKPTKSAQKWADLLSKSALTTTTASSPTDSPMEKEMDLYSTLPVLPDKSDDPLIWWKQNEAIFPHLAKIARKYLCVQATSVASERVFSAAANIVTKKRNKLKPSKINMLCFLAINLKK